MPTVKGAPARLGSAVCAAILAAVLAPSVSLAADPAASTASAALAPARLLFWAITFAAGLVFLAIVARARTWLAHLSLRDRVLVALTSSLGLVGVTLPTVPILAVASVVLGPFMFLASDLFFKLELFLIVGAMMAWVPRPGVYTLFYLVWMGGQALLSGYLGYGPVILLFAGIAVTLVEGAWWMQGLTRGRAVSVLWASLAVGGVEAAVVYWDVSLIQAYFRYELPLGMQLLQAASGGICSAIGFGIGLPLGRRLRAVQRPDLPLLRGGADDPLVEPLAARAELAVRTLIQAYPGAPKPTLDGVSFTLTGGEIVLLAGPTGCGKSTVLRAIQGLLPVPEGAITLDGAPRTAFSQSAWVRHCTLLMQEPDLQLMRLTPRSELRLALELASTASRAIGDRGAPSDAEVDAALAPLDLGPMADRPYDQLSGGERLRVVLAALLAARPRVLLLDEPLAHLDRAHRERLLVLLRDLATQGTAVLIAEHRCAELLPHAHRVLWMEDGRIAWSGPASEFRQPIPLPAELGRCAAAQKAEPLAAGAALDLNGVLWRHRNATHPLFGPITARAPTGSAILLSGPNGAGKSTLLEILAGLRRPTEGEASLAGTWLTRMKWTERSRRVGLLPQRADATLCAPTVAEELALPLKARGMDATRISAAVETWLDRLELRVYAGRFPHLLSRGERQRLALGTVLVAEPELLLLDEPFAGQGAAQIARIGVLCRDYLAGDPARALILATHDLDPARGWTNRHWHLENGQLTQSAPEADDLSGEPGTLQSRRRAGGRP